MSKKITVRLHLPNLASLKSMFRTVKKRLWIRNPNIRSSVILCLTALIISEFAALLQPYFTQHAYTLGNAEVLLSEKSDFMAKKITYDATQQAFLFNNGQAVNAGSANAGQLVTATVAKDPAKGVKVSDPANQVDFSLTPKFNLLAGKQDGNRILYPLANGMGWAVYTMHGTGVKEDVILSYSPGDTYTLDYTMGLGSSLDARLESDGSIGVYGNTLFSGNVTTGSEKDAALLQKARENAKKDTLLFTIPKPVIIEKGKKQSSIKAAYKLNGDNLQIKVSGLKKGSYPLSIDPSIYVVTAQQFMAGNNETNINFNVADKLIEKGRTTGARFDSWNSTTDLPGSSWGSGTVAAGGYVYRVGGTTFNGQIFTSQGSDSYVVPAGVTSLTLKMWGAGGGGGGGGTTSGAAGGGGGFVESTISVTPGETLTVYVGGGGNGGNFSASGSDAGGGGGGGGFSSIYRGGTPLAIAAGGGGGGGARAGVTGGTGGAGGGTTGESGVTRFTNNGGGGSGGTQSAGGSAGSATSGANAGTAGSSLTGGLGGDGRNGSGADGSGASGGLTGAGDGGLSNVSTTRAGGGGGGSGYFGGGGGSGTTSTTNSGGGGGGGGSSFTAAGSTGVTNTVGNGAAPGNSSDASRNGAGDGGSGGNAGATGSSGDNGIVTVSYGAGSTTTQSVSWAKFNTSSGAIDSANPGSGTCSGWCTTSAYNLPSARSNFSLVAYNGFLYAIGGVDSAGTRQSTVYIAKLGANGEPRKWHPTDTNQNNWVYWHQDTNLSSARADTTAVAYNNRMYLLGGLSTSGPVSTTEVANINPTGTLGSWTSSTALPSALYGHGAQVYNDRLYVLGGASSIGGTPSSSVYYVKINSDGSLNNWIQTSSFTTGRIGSGGNISTVWGGYLYISGGCSAVNGSGYCTTVQADTQVASINADGSIDIWNTVGGVSDQRMGASLLAWRDNIYEIGGCSAQNTTTGDCNGAMLKSIIYGSVNQDGDASTVSESVTSGTSPCSGADPYNCDMPTLGSGTGQIGQMLNATAILNGYLYVIGGCANTQCSQASGNTAYVSIASDGTLTKPSTCSGTLYGSWCVDSTNTISGGIAAASTVVFGGRIYVVGGLNGASNANTITYNTTNADGSLSGAWTSQSMSGVGAASVSYEFAYARANPSSTTNPGNLYIFGGCTNSSSAGCNNNGYSQAVYKCNIQSSGAIASCSTSGQLQIGTIAGATGAGLAAMCGTVYANYVYLAGGLAPNLTDLKTVRYAKIDNNNNIVAVSGSAWVEATNQTDVGRRRGAAFGYNGYLYVVGGYDGGSGSVLADIEFAKINVSDGSIGTFSTSAVTINQRWGLSVPVSNSFAYVIGGCDVGLSPSCSSFEPMVQAFQIYNNDSGSPAGYATSANTYSTNPNRIGASSTILNGYLYVAGGCTSATDCTAATTNVSYAPIDVNGVVGSWSSTTGALPAARTWGKLEAAGGTLYYIGGQDSTATNEQSTVYYATPASGNVSSWSTATNGLPAARTKFGAAVWNDRLYVVGGLDSSASPTSTVYVSPQLTAGGNIGSAWSTSSTSFNVARSGLTAITYANNLYVLGGYDGTNYLSDSQYSQINSSTGNAGSWSYSTSLPTPVSQAEGFAANGYLYLVGGRSNATTCLPSTLVAPMSANTTIASGNNPTGTGDWYQTNQKYTGNRYGASVAYSDGKAYVLGGACGSTLTYASPVTQQTALLSQPQVAKYSIAIDTDSDVFPTSWLLNGIDNSIGAKWRLKYRSMTNTSTLCTSPAMSTWGQETNFGDVSLGVPGVYTPLNGSGVSTNCARFYYFNVTVDSSQAFGYPDDVTRGPTITDLTLQFTADPSKRLMHGRTFTGGLQQPVDTPYYQQ